MKLRRRDKAVAILVAWTLLIFDTCLAEENKKEIQLQEAQTQEEDIVYQEGLLDSVLSREKTLPQEKCATPKYETFEEKLQSAKEKERRQSISKERERENDSIRRMILY